MTDRSTRAILAASIALSVQSFSSQELAALYNTVTFPGASPKDKLFDYEKVEHLFTEDNGMRMHAETIEALGVVVNMRLEATTGEMPGGR